MRRFLVFVLLIAGIMLFFLDMGHSPGSAVRQLYGFAHLVFFMFIAIGLSRLPILARRPFFVQFVVIMSVVFLVGAIIEVIQPYFGRSGSWRDLGINVLGALFGVMFLAPARRSVSRGLLVCGQLSAMTLAVVMFHGPVITLWDMWQASRQFPVLSDFETPFEARRWSSGEIDKTFVRHGQASLRVAMGTEKYAGTTLVRSFGDWQGYSTFAFSLYNPDADPLHITVSIRDEEHWRRGGEYEDRFNRVFSMGQGWNEVHIPVADIAHAPAMRKLELNQLNEVVIFTVDPPVPRVMYLDYVRLIR